MVQITYKFLVYSNLYPARNILYLRPALSIVELIVGLHNAWFYNVVHVVQSGHMYDSIYCPKTCGYAAHFEVQAQSKLARGKSRQNELYRLTRFVSMAIEK